MNTGVKRKHDEDSNAWKKKQIALQRWQILAQTLRGRGSSETQLSAVSVRRFQTFGLLQTEILAERTSREDGEATWYLYTCPSSPHLAMNIRHVRETVKPEDLLGFNNTGNVCVWPSEEVMTYFCLQHLDDFRDNSVIELGGGMTCLAGVALASLTSAQRVVVTDGNEQSVHNLQLILEDNDFGDTQVDARLLRWGPEAVEQDLQEAFDFVLCADCLFFDEGRQDLVNTIFSLLKPKGQALVFAPGRNGTFDTFCQLARARFVMEKCPQYDDHIYSLQAQLKASSATFTEDLHFPLLVKLTKGDHNAASRDVTPESR